MGTWEREEAEVSHVIQPGRVAALCIVTITGGGSFAGEDTELSGGAQLDKPRAYPAVRKSEMKLCSPEKKQEVVRDSLKGKVQIMKRTPYGSFPCKKNPEPYKLVAPGVC